MIIKIISCTNPEFWYVNKIGEILEVNKCKGFNGETVYEYHGEDINKNKINGLFNLRDIIEICPYFDSTKSVMKKCSTCKYSEKMSEAEDYICIYDNDDR
jgi:hypothetical protein